MAEKLVKPVPKLTPNEDLARDDHARQVAAEAADTYRALAESVKRAGQNELDRALLRA